MFSCLCHLARCHHALGKHIHHPVPHFQQPASLQFSYPLSWMISKNKNCGSVASSCLFGANHYGTCTEYLYCAKHLTDILPFGSHSNPTSYRWSSRHRGVK
jgi:hypothetical protein